MVAGPMIENARAAAMYGSTGTLERAAVPVIQTQSVRRTQVDRPRPTYDDTDLEIPSFLRRPAQEEKG